MYPFIPLMGRLYETGLLHENGLHVLEHNIQIHILHKILVSINKKPSVLFYEKAMYNNN